MKKNFFLFGSFVISAVFFAFWIFLKIPLEVPFPSESPRIFDIRNNLLFWGLSADEEYFWKIDFDDISPNFVNAVIAAEDTRFWQHRGFDGIAILRAAKDNLLAGGIFSGASTLPQQVVKKMRDNPPRTFTEKIIEIGFAMRLEEELSKEEIFADWANLAPFSGNIRGVEAASRIFFKKSAHDLSPAEAAFLAAIPQNPNRKFDVLLTRQKSILRKMRAEDFLSEEELMHALTEKMSDAKHFPENTAPHFSRFLLDLFPTKSVFRTSLDSKLQEAAMQILQGNLSILANNNAKNGAILVFENASGAIKIWIGSADFSKKNIDGQVDVLRSFRQVGSTLKPFVYLRAFEKLGWTSETTVLDEPQNFPVDHGNFFEPKDYDLDFRGAISVRSAIAESRNVPAVATLEKIGVSDFLSFLGQLGADFLSENPEDSGLGIALGSAEIRLVSLAKLYGILARAGNDFSFCMEQKCFPQEGIQILNKNFVLEMTDILTDNSARIPSFSENSALNFSFPVAAKTGTTRNFDDNFVVGFTTDFTVLVWVGNADGSAMKEVSGISGAGPIFHDVVNLLARKYPPRAFEKASPRNAKKEEVSALRILSPLPGSQFVIDPTRPLETQKILFKTNSTAIFLLDNAKITSGTKFLWEPTRGRHLLRVKSGNDVAKSEFWVK